MDSKPEKKIQDSTETDTTSVPQKVLNKGFLAGILIFAIPGAVLALYATNLTFKLTVAGIVEPSECSFNDWLTCDTVLSTGYAKMFGLPVAWWGFLYYLWSVFTVIFAFPKTSKPDGMASLKIIFFITSIATLFSLFKMYQLFALGVICPVCVAMYISIFGIFFFTMKALGIPFKKTISININYFKSIFKKKKGEEDKDGEGYEAAASHSLRYLIILVWFFAMGFFGLKYYENTVIKPGLSNIQLIVTEHFKQEPLEINTDAAAGESNTESVVKIVSFSDFECPACKLLAVNMKAVMMEYKDEAGFYFMNYPLDKSINTFVKNEIHKNAGLAAIAGVCAQNQGNFWSYHDALFENQTKINPEYLTKLAQEQGLDMQKFTECLESEAVKQRVIQDIETGKESGVSGTPTLFINGRKVHYWNSSEVIKAIIKEEMAKSGN